MTSHSVLNSAAEAATCVFPSGLFELNWGGFNVSQIVFLFPAIFFEQIVFLVNWLFIVLMLRTPTAPHHHPELFIGAVYFGKPECKAL